jgi:hypothetical protein
MTIEVRKGAKLGPFPLCTRVVRLLLHALSWLLESGSLDTIPLQLFHSRLVLIYSLRLNLVGVCWGLLMPALSPCLLLSHA